ncbi:MAG: hypothetical protein U0936_10265 [Planctomycetaceae bacterium]
MIESWMKLDYWGQPIPDSAFSEMIRVELDPQTLRQRVQHKSDTLRRLVEELLNSYSDGDMILWVNSPKRDWEELMGSESYVLLRKGFLVYDVLLRMN